MVADSCWWLSAATGRRLVVAIVWLWLNGYISNHNKVRRPRPKFKVSFFIYFCCLWINVTQINFENIKKRYKESFLIIVSNWNRDLRLMLERPLSHYWISPLNLKRMSRNIFYVIMEITSYNSYILIYISTASQISQIYKNVQKLFICFPLFLVTLLASVFYQFSPRTFELINVIMFRVRGKYKHCGTCFVYSKEPRLSVYSKAWLKLKTRHVRKVPLTGILGNGLTKDSTQDWVLNAIMNWFMEHQFVSYLLHVNIAMLL